MTDDIVLIDKPIGITSFDVIRRLRRELNIRKMGHAGTLDPLASGLMIIGVAAGTKKLAEYIKLDKEYVAEILVGIKTETGDLEGKVVEEKAVEEDVVADIFSSEKISATLNEMLGTLTLPVSAYSAIKKGGVPFYKKAREAKLRGQTLDPNELPIREMKVINTELLEYNYDKLNHRMIIKVRFEVGSGTYIRSLAEEFGKRFGYPATLQSLRRTKVGNFKIENARSI